MAWREGEEEKGSEDTGQKEVGRAYSKQEDLTKVHLCT